MKDFIVKNYLNQIPADRRLSYDERLTVLRERKIAQTEEKVRREGGLNEDDYGRIVAPADFQWSILPNHPDGSFYGYRGWAENFAALLSKHPIYVDPLDAFSGKWIFFLSRLKGPIWPPEFDYSHLQPAFDRYNIICGIGSDAHFAPDYRIGLELGWGGLLEKLRHYQALHGPEHQPFYEAEQQTIRAVQTWIRRTNRVIRELAAIERHPQLRKNLQEMYEVNEWVVEKPPRTLREACQWLCWFNMASRTYNRDGAGGQLDELLRPYYTRDLAAGLIDDDAARFYLACLLLNDTHYYQLGGPDPDGRDLTSRISYLILEAAHQINTSCNLTIRVHDGLDPQFFLKSVEYLFTNKNGWPRYSGDKALVEGFTRCGFPAELARQRIAVGCNWMSLPGLEYTMNDLVKVNTAKVFEVAFQELMATVAQPTVAKLWELFAKHLRLAVEATARGIAFHLEHQADNEPELMLNLLSHGPVEKGLDVAAGGAQFYNMAIDGAGIAVVADSFAALETWIEQEAKISWSGLAGQLRADYAGVEGEYIRRMMQRAPRYGEGDSAGDAWGWRISALFTDLVREQNGHYPYNFIPGWFSWANTIDFGKAVGATPNGRRAGEPINHGANPLPGFRKDGAVTALANTVAAIQPAYGNTAPIQLELDPKLAGDAESVQKIADLIRAIFDNGATLLNINIIDKAKILAAHQDPSQYPDLVVRVTGFTAYFAMLSPDFRQLVVDRIIES
ncbi:formate C-acetyltransferase [Hydrogenispora ethanolica]|uniref:Formate C-acetyltransferase n=1 Tax=Hydrogenispora ethanolica TaxID=1082276 RepID=A0A4V2QE31_HYDET|nr:pyruvate formate lyase family protein [Hydrogenispora ethanolica]TCL66517.1 formate C-acetyltransferase [Hydrogenispora ethanolica]